MSEYVFSNNANSTLANSLAASSGATTATLVTGGGAKFPNPGANEYFAITFFSSVTNTGTPNEICLCTHRAGDVLTLIRGQEGTAFQAWNVGDQAQHFLTAGAANAFLQVGDVRNLLTGATSFYVATTGNDSNDGSMGSPWATIGHALDVIGRFYDLGGYAVSILVSDGTYNENLAVTAPFTGAGRVTVIGNSSNWENVLINGLSSGYCAEAVNGAVLNFQYCGFTSGNGCLLAAQNGIVEFTNCWFGSAGVDHLHTNSGGVINAGGDYYLAANAPVHAEAFGGPINVAGRNLDLQSTPHFSTALFVADAMGVIFAQSMSFTNTGTGAGWRSSYNSYFDTNGSSGNITAAGFSAGSTDHGGQAS